MKIYQYTYYDPALRIIANDRTTYKMTFKNGSTAFSIDRKISRKEDAEAVAFDRYRRINTKFYHKIDIYSTEIDGDTYTLTTFPTDNGNYQIILERVDFFGEDRTFHGTRPTRPTINDAADFIRRKAAVDGQRPTAIERDLLKNLKQE